MGWADFAFYPIMPSDTAFIIELKKDETPDKAKITKPYKKYIKKIYPDSIRFNAYFNIKVINPEYNKFLTK